MRTHHAYCDTAPGIRTLPTEDFRVRQAGAHCDWTDLNGEWSNKQEKSVGAVRVVYGPQVRQTVIAASRIRYPSLDARADVRTRERRRAPRGSGYAVSQLCVAP
jgi:hypothetical protein